MPFRNLIKYLVGLPALAVILCLLLVWAYAFTPGPDDGGQDSIEVSIPADTGLCRIQELLEDRKVVRKDVRFRILARLMGLEHRLKAGEYVFEGGRTPYQVLLTLERGMVIRHAVTIPEGVSMYRIADILADNGWENRDRFLRLARDPYFIKDLGLAQESLEGYFFPDTYHLVRGQPVRTILKMMVERTSEVFREIGWQPDETGFSRHEILTLASIVEKETARPKERPLIAAVLLNRLKKGMRLQADPTVMYGLGKSNGRLTYKDLRTPTPYNTYLNKGMPPGPIGNPGRAAIEAVLQPADASYYYFVSKNNGSHFFSETLTEHNRAVWKYQKKRKQKQKKL